MVVDKRKIKNAHFRKNLPINMDQQASINTQDDNCIEDYIIVITIH